MRGAKPWAWPLGLTPGVDPIGMRHFDLVRYAPGSRIERHGHRSSEEILLLAGVFQDDLRCRARMPKAIRSPESVAADGAPAPLQVAA